MRRMIQRTSFFVLVLFAFVFVGTLPVFSQQADKASEPVVILTALASPRGDTVAETLASTITSSIALMLKLTGRVTLRRADFLIPTTSLQRTIPYYVEHNAAEAVYGLVRPAGDGAYAIELDVWTASHPNAEPTVLKRTISNVLSSFNLADEMSLRLASTIVGKKLEEGTLVVQNVTSLPRFSVYADGHLLGRNRTSFRLLTGNWKIVVAKPGEVGDVAVQTFHVDVHQGKTATVALSPLQTVNHASGSISLSAATAATLYIDGRKIGHIAAGTSTLTSVRVGIRNLAMHYTDGHVARMTVRVRKGSTATASFTYGRSGQRSRWNGGTLPKSEPWQSVAYGGGTFVAVASNSKVTAISRDGVHWTEGSLPSSGSWQSVAYGGGTFVAVAAYSDVVATSRDGVHWRKHTMSSGADWQSVTYGNGTFVAVAANSSVVTTSPNGVNWTESSLPNLQEWQSVTYGGGTFVAVASGSSVAATSKDGANWTQRYLADTQNWSSVAYGNGAFVAVAANSGVVSTSRNGVDWVDQRMPSNEAWQSVTYGNGIFVAVASYSKTAATSP